jgi:hypothetical protein
LLESEWLLPWKLYDLADPAHPVLRGHARLDLGGIANSGSLLYQDWRRGVLEFHAANGSLEARRYLTDGHKNSARRFAAADGYVYTMKYVEDRRTVSAYRVTP